MDAEKGTGPVRPHGSKFSTTPTVAMNGVMTRFAGYVLAKHAPFTTTGRTCLGCGAKTDQRGVLPCGH